MTPQSRQLDLVHAAFVRGRIKEAAAVGVVFSVVAVLGAFLSEMPSKAAPYSLALVAVGLVFSYLGRGWGRVALPGLMLGVLPLACSLSAQAIGHICTPQGCTSLCIPLCGAGGLMAGFLLARFAVRQSSPWMVWAGGGVLVLLTGSVGCSCIGLASTGSMGLSLLIGSALPLVSSRGH